MVTRIELNVPLLKLGSKPIDILIDDIILIANMNSKEDWEQMDCFSYNFKSDKLMHYVEKLTSEFARVKSSQSYSDKMIVKIVDNLQISIK